MVACIATLLSLNSQAQEIAHGALDKSFRPTLDGNVFVVLPNSDGTIMVGGSFANAGYNDEDAVYMGNIIRLNSNGNPDKSFNTGGIGFDNSVYSILRTPEGKYLVSGRFSKYNDQPVGMLVRLMPDGSLDPTFNNNNTFTLDGFHANYTPSVSKIFIHPSGQIYVVGGFNKVNDIFAPFVARFSADGQHDGSYQPVDKVNFKTDPSILGAYMDHDGSFFITGSFSRYGGITGCDRVVRFLPDGSLDPEFQSPEFKDSEDGGCTVKSITPYDTGRYLVAGDFVKVNEQERFLTCVIDRQGNVVEEYKPFNFSGDDNNITWAAYYALRYMDWIFVAGGDVTAPQTSFIHSFDSKGSEITDGFKLDTKPDRTATFLYADPINGWLYVSGLFNKINKDVVPYFGRISIAKDPMAIQAPIIATEEAHLTIHQEGSNLFITASDAITEASLYSIEGKLLTSGKSLDEATLQIKTPSAGNYFVKVVLVNGTTATKKLIVR